MDHWNQWCQYAYACFYTKSLFCLCVCNAIRMHTHSCQGWSSRTHTHTHALNSLISSLHSRALGGGISYYVKIVCPVYMYVPVGQSVSVWWCMYMYVCSACLALRPSGGSSVRGNSLWPEGKAQCSRMIPQETEDLAAKESRRLLAVPYPLERQWHTVSPSAEGGDCMPFSRWR